MYICRTDSSSIQYTSFILNNTFDQLFYEKPQIIINGVPPLLLYCNTRLTHTAGAAEVSLSTKAVLGTYRAFDAEIFPISSCANIIDSIPVYLRVVIFWPRRSHPCRRRGPVYEEKHYNIRIKSSNVKNHEK